MLAYTKSTTFNGHSDVSLDGTTAQVVILTGSINESGSVFTSTSIQNPELYKQNKAAVDKDIADFNAAVYQFI